MQTSINQQIFYRSTKVGNEQIHIFEEKALRSASLQLKMWVRYVDDTFVIWPHGKEEMNRFHDHLNGQHPAIQFTREEEVEGRIPFLDALVERKGSRMKTSVYRKPTSTDRYIHYSSHHQRRVLRGTLCSMRGRAHNLCRDSSVDNELIHLTRVFESNGYPSVFVRRVLDEPPTWNNGSADKIEEEEESKPKVLYLPYVRGVSERIERRCRNLGVRTVFKSHNTLRQTLMNVKSRTPKECKRGAVYEIPCADCDSVYIGETGRSLKDRIKEHKYAVSRGDMKNGVAAHAWSSQHKVDWSSAKVRTVEQ